MRLHPAALAAFIIFMSPVRGMEGRVRPQLNSGDVGAAPHEPVTKNRLRGAQDVVHTWVQVGRNWAKKEASTSSNGSEKDPSPLSQSMDETAKEKAEAKIDELLAHEVVNDDERHVDATATENSNSESVGSMDSMPNEEVSVEHEAPEHQGPGNEAPADDKNTDEENTDDKNTDEENTDDENTDGELGQEEGGERQLSLEERLQQGVNELLKKPDVMMKYMGLDFEEIKQKLVENEVHDLVEYESGAEADQQVEKVASLVASMIFKQTRSVKNISKLYEERDARVKIAPVKGLAPVRGRAPATIPDK